MKNLTEVNSFPKIDIPDSIFSEAPIYNFTFENQNLIPGTLQIPFVIHSIGFHAFCGTAFSSIIFEITSFPVLFDQGAFSEMSNLTTVLGFPVNSKIPEQLFFKSNHLNTFSTKLTKCHGFHFYPEIQSFPYSAFEKTGFSCFSSPGFFDPTSFVSKLRTPDGNVLDICKSCSDPLVSLSPTVPAVPTLNQLLNDTDL
uniref:Uncharacterized protein n=1 Tax=Coptotermes formosanus TaxID=36987 RepID=R4UL94_COPFO|nr:hypothetical protein [Coptotermes formosanus]